MKGREGVRRALLLTAVSLLALAFGLVCAFFRALATYEDCK